MTRARHSLANTLTRQANAVEELATSAKPMRMRLLRAAPQIIVLHPNEFPEGPLRDLFVEIVAALTSRRAFGEEGRLKATAHRLSGPQARSIAKKIFRLFRESVSEILAAS